MPLNALETEIADIGEIDIVLGPHSHTVLVPNILNLCIFFNLINSGNKSQNAKYDLMHGLLPVHSLLLQKCSH